MFPIYGKIKFMFQNTKHISLGVGGIYPMNMGFNGRYRCLDQPAEFTKGY